MEGGFQPEKEEEAAVYDAAAGRPEKQTQASTSQVWRCSIFELVLQFNTICDQTKYGEW